MTNEDAINTLIKGPNVNPNMISDGYHTFGELYEHRIECFVAICRIISDMEKIMALLPKHDPLPPIWKSRLHSDGSRFDGWFVLGIGIKSGEQITYHLPDSKWSDCEFAETRIMAPEFDGHTSADVLERLKKL